jgi:hypothetical protein
MEFHYADRYIENKEKWAEFDLWLKELSENNPDEFAKEMYQSEKFMAVGTSSTHHAIIFTPHTQMPKYIEEQIKGKLLELWPVK